MYQEFTSAISEFQRLADEKNISFKVITPEVVPIAYFDKQRVGQVIRNLLSNALKFGENNSSIHISFSAENADDGKKMLRTTITNKGPEIPPLELKAIFDKFVQSTTTRTGAGGTGLGLSICNRIIKDLNGQIWAENGDEQTVCFHFTLPANPPTEKIGQILLQKGLVSREDLEIALQQQHTKIL